jgi:hypothetical protein
MGGEDFKGDTYYSAMDGSLYFVPNIDSGSAFGIALSIRKKWYDNECSYTRASYDWGWGGVPDWGKVTRHTANVNIKVFPLAAAAIQPFALAGCFWNWLTVEDGKYDGQSESMENESMNGLGFNFGGGVEYYVGRVMRISGGFTWHKTFYNTISGIDLDKGLSPSGVDWYFSTGVMF